MIKNKKKLQFFSAQKVGGGRTRVYEGDIVKVGISKEKYKIEIRDKFVAVNIATGKLLEDNDSNPYKEAFELGDYQYTIYGNIYEPEKFTQRQKEKINTSNKSNKEMAEVFRETGEWFLSLPEKAEVDMTKGYSNVEPKTCNSPACFGSWLSAKYRTQKGEDEKRDYIDGAIAFAKDLGFCNMHELRYWADENPKMWGNEDGHCMFNSPSAFNEEDKEYANYTITTRAIGEKLIAVAERLRKTEI